jgi:hypothetical protein
VFTSAQLLPAIFSEKNEPSGKSSAEKEGWKASFVF